MEDFYKPKIVYTDIAQRLSFAYTVKGEFLNNSAYFFSSKDENLLLYLLGVLNSALIDWYYRTVSVQLGEKGVRLFSIYVLKIPIPQRIITIRDEDEVLNIYGLSDEEKQFIRNRY